MGKTVEPRTFRTGYLDRAITNLEDLVAKAVKELATANFDTLVGTGLSGTLFIPSLAVAMDKYFVIVRKANDGSHHNGVMVGDLGRRWIFVDDFISSGDTKRRVSMAIDGVGHPTKYVGDYLYGLIDAPWYPAPGTRAKKSR